MPDNVTPSAAARAAASRHYGYDDERELAYWGNPSQHRDVERLAVAMHAFATDARSRGQAEERERCETLAGGPFDGVQTLPASTVERVARAIYLYDVAAAEPTYRQLHEDCREELRDQARAYLTAAICSGETPVGEGRGWRGIETAPKDGTRILIWLRAPYSQVEAVTWYEPWGNWQTDAEALDDADVSGIGSIVPTHWQPLPDAPAAEVGS